jgi:hypothetical protein
MPRRQERGGVEGVFEPVLDASGKLPPLPPPFFKYLASFSSEAAQNRAGKIHPKQAKLPENGGMAPGRVGRLDKPRAITQLTNSLKPSPTLPPASL